MDASMERQTGTVLKAKGNFGFITVDEPGGADMFFMPPSCKGFGGQFPPVGTRVSFTVVTDTKTGRPRAEDVGPESGAADFGAEDFGPESGAADFGAEDFGAVDSAGGEDSTVDFAAAEGGGLTGTVVKHNGNMVFGFIKQDSGEEDMFVIAGTCTSFGGQLPPIGQRLSYEVIIDAKTGRPRAENVQPLGGQQPIQSQPRPQQGMWRAKGGAPSVPQRAPMLDPAESTGTFLMTDKLGGKFGFIQQDNGEPDLFAIPQCCPGFGNTLPGVGARVAYNTAIDEKTGRARADNVRPDGESATPVIGMQRAATPSWGGAGARASLLSPFESGGTLLKNNGKFGFIQQDSGEADLFSIPQCCPGFGNTLPDIGTRVVYSVATDEKTGRPRADNVRLHPDSGGAPSSKGNQTKAGGKGGYGKAIGKSGYAATPHGFGKGNGFGKGRPQPYAAPATLPMPAAQHVPDGEMHTGTIKSHNGHGKFGFIAQDAGGDDMFVLAPSLGEALLPVGTRVCYTTTVDAKTGKIRADSVTPVAD